MKYKGTHRDVEFLVFFLDGAWKYTVNKETSGQYATRAHAIVAAIKHIDKILFEACGPQRN